MSVLNDTSVPSSPSRVFPSRLVDHTHRRVDPMVTPGKLRQHSNRIGSVLDGLPRISPSMVTTVSAESTMESLTRDATSRAFSRATRPHRSPGLRRARGLSSISGVTTEKGTPRISSSSFRRGDCDARISEGRHVEHYASVVQRVAEKEEGAHPIIINHQSIFFLNKRVTTLKNEN